MFKVKCAQKLREQGLRLYNLSIGLTDRSEEPYATHIPVLIGVAAAIKPKILIEFGCGTFSTLSFQDEVVFPSLERVESYENDGAWFDQIRKTLRSSAKIHPQLVEGAMHRAVHAASTHRAGMIFIDDSPSTRERALSVAEVARCCGAEPVAVVHDSDLWRLRLATRKFEHRVQFKAFNPQSRSEERRVGKECRSRWSPY